MSIFGRSSESPSAVKYSDIGVKYKSQLGLGTLGIK